MMSFNLDFNLPCGTVVKSVEKSKAFMLSTSKSA